MVWVSGSWFFQRSDQFKASLCKFKLPDCKAKYLFFHLFLALHFHFKWRCLSYLAFAHSFSTVPCESGFCLTNVLHVWKTDQKKTSSKSTEIHCLKWQTPVSCEICNIGIRTWKKGLSGPQKVTVWQQLESKGVKYSNIII